MVGGVALALVLVCAWLVDISQLKIRGLGNTLNDQVGYVSVARTLLLTGHLRSELIYPSVLTQAATKDYLYLPGYYAVLAATYAVFGFGAIQSVIPSMAAYCIASVALFAAVSKLYGQRVGTLAAVLFAVFPATLVYSLTAMEELTLIATAVIAFCVFVYLPLAWKVVIGPLLLVFPLLFRETGIVLVIPFALVILMGERARQPWAAAIFAFTSAVVVAMLLQSDLAAGRPTLALIGLFSQDERFIYNNAFTVQAQPSVLDLAAALITKFVHNARLVVSLFTSSARALRNWADGGTAVVVLESVSLGLMLFGGALTGVAVIRRPREPLLIGTLLMVCGLMAAILALYFVRYFQAVRILLLAVPFECAACAVLLERARRPVQYLVIGLAAACGISLTYAALRPDPVEISVAQRDLAFTESISHDDRSVLVAPPALAFDYVYTHYPVKWSFVPANRETLHLLSATYPVGTLVLSFESNDTELTLEDLDREGFTLVQSARLNGDMYLVFKRLGPVPAFSPVVTQAATAL